jgi:hypothetical protein
MNTLLGFLEALGYVALALLVMGLVFAGIFFLMTRCP